MSLRAELLISREVPEEHRGDYADDLAGFDLDVNIVRPLDHRGSIDPEWIVLLSLPLQAFLAGLGAEAVQDFRIGLKRMAGRVLKRGDGDAVPPRPMVLHDRERDLEIVLEPGLPDEAYAQLFALDLSTFRKGPVHFDRAQGRWRSELDEAAG